MKLFNRVSNGDLAREIVGLRAQIEALDSAFTHRLDAHISREVAGLRTQMQTLESALTYRLDRITAAASGPHSEIEQGSEGWSRYSAYNPELVPPLSLMLQERIENLEEWFRWGEEWSFLLRQYGRLTSRSQVLEIGCGLGRIAFSLRHLLSGGLYRGFDIIRDKI